MVLPDHWARNYPLRQRALTDLYWAAGFIEGEGCFHKTSTGPMVTCCQVQREPLERLQNLIGGNICSVSNQRSFASKNAIIYVWRIYGPTAIGFMLTIYSICSPRRQDQIRQALARWRGIRRAAKLQIGMSCNYGHKITRASDLYTGRASRPSAECRLCRQLRPLLKRLEANQP